MANKVTTLDKPQKKAGGPAWTARQIAELRDRHIIPGTGVFYTKPLVVARAEGVHIYDAEGRKYLDGFAGVATVSIGHCHPHWVKKIQDQAATLYHTTMIYLYPQLVEYAQELLKRLKPANPALDACFFTNSGCEANELAAMLAKNHTGRSEFVALRHSYHGRTLMAMSFTGQSTWRHSGPYPFGVYHVPANYTYRRPEPMTPRQYSDFCAEEVEQVIQYSTSGKIAAYIAEPITGLGGVIDPEPEYFPKVYDIVKRHGGLFISDEVQTGVGRSGKHFLGIQHWGVKPDIVTMAKGIGNGYPLAAVATTREVADSMKGKLHFNTYGGGPVACAAGMAVLEVLEGEKLVDNAHEVGSHLKSKLLNLVEKSPYVGDVRGKGLMLGVEIVRSKKTKEPAPDLLGKILDGMKDRGVLVGKGGMAGNVMRIKPPLCITKKDADTIASALEDFLKSL